MSENTNNTGTGPQETLAPKKRNPIWTWVIVILAIYSTIHLLYRINILAHPDNEGYLEIVAREKEEARDRGARPYDLKKIKDEYPLSVDRLLGEADTIICYPDTSRLMKYHFEKWYDGRRVVVKYKNDQAKWCSFRGLDRYNWAERFSIFWVQYAEPVSQTDTSETIIQNPVASRITFIRSHSHPDRLSAAIVEFE